MANDGDGTDRADRAATPLAQRVAQTQEQARVIAGRLASTSDDVAAALDAVADTREARADQATGDEAERLRHEAQRARQRAEGERRDARELREKWNPPR